MYKSKNVPTEILKVILSRITFIYDIEIVEGGNIGTETVIFDSKGDYLKFEHKLNNPYK